MAADRIRKERLARLLVTLFALALPAVVLMWSQPSSPGIKVIHASMPETGGWAPDTLHARAGEPLTLRLTSQDVVHGFAVGKQNQPAVDVLPGEVTEITLAFDEPGKYVYYCTRWCGPEHWRMRGTIIVEGPRQISDPAPPLYSVMGFDLDIERTTAVKPDHTPSVQAGQRVMRGMDADNLAPFRDKMYLKTHSPARVWQALRGATFTENLSDGQLWDLVAALWRIDASTEDIATGQQLYMDNCAACHGPNGDGQGIFADKVPSQEEIGKVNRLSDTVSPADFTDPRRMLSVNPAILQGKIIRGGMGTGMPYFGPIFTKEQTWKLVDYLWTFQFSE